MRQRVWRPAEKIPRVLRTFHSSLSVEVRFLGKHSIQPLLAASTSFEPHCPKRKSKAKNLH